MKFPAVDIGSIKTAVESNLLPIFFGMGGLFLFGMYLFETQGEALALIQQDQDSDKQHLEILSQTQDSISVLIENVTRTASTNAAALEEHREINIEMQEALLEHAQQATHPGVAELAWAIAVDAMTLSNYVVEQRRLTDLTQSLREAVQSGSTQLRDDLERAERNLQFYTNEIREIEERNLVNQ